MPSSPWSLALPIPLAIAIVVAIIVLAGYVVRASERRRRRRSRHEIAELQRAFSMALGDGIDPAALRRLLDHTSPGVFWSALEGNASRLDYVRWLELSRVLESNRFSRRERRALRDDSPWRRVLAARRVGLLRSDRSRLALRRAMVRGPEIVTHAAALALARARDRGALRWLLRHPGALAHRSSDTLAGVLQSFGSAGYSDLARALEAGLDSHRMERAVIEVLGAARFSAVRPALERRLASGDFDVRVAAVRALGRLQALESCSSLLAALKDEAWQVRCQAARALGRVGADVAITALAARLSDPAWWVRHHAAYALLELGHNGVTALRHIAATSEDPYARDMANEALEGGYPIPGRPGARRFARGA